jgi:DNA-binding LacI/PurR family transcriptional regulator
MFQQRRHSCEQTSSRTILNTRMISIKDIARAAQVSHSTVSRALRGSPLVNPETRELICRIAAEQGYTPSAVARSLVTRRTDTIGIVVTSIADPFVGEVVTGVEAAMNARGYSVILATCHADPDREIRAVRSFQERRVDGILVTASRVGALYQKMLEETRTPIVLINNQHAGEFAYHVSIDNPAGARLMTGRLLELGHRRIAYIGDRFGLHSDEERCAGYRDRLEQAGIPFAPELVANGDGGAESGLVAMRQLLDLADPPTAVFCYNDMQAFGAIRAVRDRGLRVPADISIGGFDDLFLASYCDPPLTTIRQPKQEMGRDAANLLMDLIAGGNPTSCFKTGVLVERQSTAARRA